MERIVEYQFGLSIGELEEHWLNLFHLNSSRRVILDVQKSSIWLLIDQEFAQRLIET